MDKVRNEYIRGSLKVAPLGGKLRSFWVNEGLTDPFGPFFTLARELMEK